jgi:hypothetical protein
MCFGHTYFSAFSFFIAFELIRKWSCGKLPKKGAHKTKHGKYALEKKHSRNTVTATNIGGWSSRAR